jgi:hypothetical protein
MAKEEMRLSLTEMLANSDLTATEKEKARFVIETLTSGGATVTGEVKWDADGAYIEIPIPKDVAATIKDQ